MRDVEMHNLLVKVTGDELAKAHALAGEHYEPLSIVVRRMIREAYKARFGDKSPPSVELRSGKRVGGKC